MFSRIIKTTLQKQSGQGVLKSLLISTLLVFSFGAAAEGKLNDIYYNTLLSDEIEFTFGFEQALINEPTVKTFTDPARIEISFDAGEFVAPLADTQVNHAGIKSIDVKQVNGKVLATIFLEELKLYQVGIVEGKFVILLNSLSNFDKNQPQSDVASDFINNIQAIDFRKGDSETEAGQLLVFLDDSMSAVDVSDTLGKIHTDEVKTAIIRQSVGSISESDVILAAASGAFIIGFHVSP